MGVKKLSPVQVACLVAVITHGGCLDGGASTPNKGWCSYSPIALYVVGVGSFRYATVKALLKAGLLSVAKGGRVTATAAGVAAVSA